MKLLTSRIWEDEFSRGYRGRLRVLNQYSSVLKFMADLRKTVHSPETPSDECPAAVTLALAAGISPEQFVQKHSLLPFHLAVFRENSDVGQGNRYSLQTIGYFGTRGWRKSMAMLCPACVAEDMVSPGFAYWRRSHQLPGIPWCHNHGCQLANSPSGTKAFDNMPSLDTEALYEFSESEFLGLSENPVIQRYANIVFAFLDSERSMPEIEARFRISELAKKHQLRISQRGQRPTLTDMLLDHVPKYWLRTFYPDIEKRSSTEFFYPIDDITRGVAADQSYALALAVLFDSAEEALSYWYGDIDGMPTERKAQRSFGKDYWVSTEMFKLYIEHKGNYNTISKAIAITPSYLRAQLATAGLPGLGLVSMNTTAKAILDFHAGMALEAACKSNGASQEEVERLIRVGVARLVSAINEMLQSNPSVKRSD